MTARPRQEQTPGTRMGYMKASGKLEVKMTPKQIDTLASMIVVNLPALLRARPWKEGEQPNKPKNAVRLYFEPNDVKLLIRAALNQESKRRTRPYAKARYRA